MAPLKFLAYNVQLFPKQIYPVYRLLFKCDENTKVKNRVEKIATSLRNTNADVVLLSEMWDLQAIQYFKQTLGDLYPHSYNPDGVIKYPLIDPACASGLLLLSKYPITDKMFIPFHHAQHAELLVKKGFIVCTIEIPEIGNVHRKHHIGLIGTHVQAYGYAKTRQRNVRQIMRAIAQYQYAHSENPSNTLVVLGDFNVPSRNLEFEMIETAMKSQGLYNAQTIAANGSDMCARGLEYANSLPCNELACYRKCVCNLDYIYTSTSDPNRILYYTAPDALSPAQLQDSFADVYRDSESGIMLSDHLPIMAVVDDSGNPGNARITGISESANEPGVQIIDSYEFNDKDFTIQDIIFIFMLILVIIIGVCYATKISKETETEIIL